MTPAAFGALTYEARGGATAALVLAHGAGAGQTHPFMVNAATGLAARGIDVVTFDFPYMAEGRRAPDRAPVLEQRFRDVLSAARAWTSASRVFIGGKSMGGRMATHLAAEDAGACAGVLVFGYPLHPPGRPDQLRIAHLPAIRVPVIVVQGERDTFGTPDELRPHLAAVPGRVTLHVVAGGDHSLVPRIRNKDQVLGQILDAAAGWMRGVAAGTNS